MSETVECSECRTRYDSQEHPFCPRCGSTSRGTPLPGALASARRNDPTRRRVQASGAVLVSVGGLLLFIMAVMLALSPRMMAAGLDLMHSDELESLPGGNLTVEVLRDGAPVAGVPVELRTGNGTAFLQATTDGDGRVQAALGNRSTATVAVLDNGTEFRRNATAQAGQDTVLAIDLARDPAVVQGWVGQGPLLQVLRILLAVGIGLCLLLVGAGISALRLRAWAFAFTAGIIAALPFLIFFLATQQLGFLLILLLIGIPVVLIGRGRRHFQRPAPTGGLEPPTPPREPPQP